MHGTCWRSTRAGRRRARQADRSQMTTPRLETGMGDRAVGCEAGSAGGRMTARRGQKNHRRSDRIDSVQSKPQRGGAGATTTRVGPGVATLGAVETSAWRSRRHDREMGTQKPPATGRRNLSGAERAPRHGQTWLVDLQQPVETSAGRSGRLDRPPLVETSARESRSLDPMWWTSMTAQPTSKPQRWRADPPTGRTPTEIAAAICRNLSGGEQILRPGRGPPSAWDAWRVETSAE